MTLAEWKVTRYQKRLIHKVLKSGRLSSGPYTRKLEEEFARVHGVNHALFTSSGTAALKISIGALKEKYGWKDGSEVLIPAVTFVATMNAVLMNNLTPVLVDVDIKTVNMNPYLIEDAITKKTVAIVPVHLLGQVASMWDILSVAKKHGLKVIEDSCETMFVRQVKGDVACFSTYIAHLMVTGVGGFICTNDTELDQTMRSMMFHGRDTAYLGMDDNLKTGDAFMEMVHKRFHFPRFGYSDRLTEMEAALGLGDMRTYPKMIKKRQKNAKYLIDHLQDLPMSFPVTEIKGHAFMFFPILAQDRDGLVEHLEKRGIHTRLMMPLTTQPIVKKHIKKLDFPGADHINRYGLLIGCHQYLSRKDLKYAVKTIREFYA